MTEDEMRACAYLPPRLQDVVRDMASRWHTTIAEIRLRREGALSLTVGYPKRRALSGVTCTADELDGVVERLSGGSRYAQEENLREGVLITADGLRVGVAGDAVVLNGTLSAVRTITALNIRIPHRVPGAGDVLSAVVEACGSTLLVSPPGMGKTTMLRELIPRLARNREIAVIDTRYELSAGLPRDGMVAWYIGWPRHTGMAAAVRTMAPDCVLCDELATQADLDAVRMAASAGVIVIATAHGESAASILRHPILGAAVEAGLFPGLCGIENGTLVPWRTA